MTKSHAEELSRVYDGLFADFSYAYPTLRAEFEKDRARLARAVEDRGVGVYYTDLPKLGKHLDKCLASGAYVQPALPLSRRVSSCVVIPKFLRGLYLRIFDGSGAMKEDYDVQAIAFLRQVLYLAKKATVDCSDHNVRTEVRAFVDVDSQLPCPEEIWDKEVVTDAHVAECFRGFAASKHYAARVDNIARDASQKRRLTALLANLDRMSSLVTSFLGAYEPLDWRFRHGPGAVSNPEVSGNKYRFTNWSSRLEREFPQADVAFHCYSSWAERTRWDELEDVNPSSRLIAVPKTFSKPRLIAAEPTEHQWCQQSLRDYFYSRSAHTWINEFVRFRDQTLNQRMCREASRTGALVTVDLSAASDRVSCTFVGNLFRSNPKLVRCLQASRTTHMRIELGKLLTEDGAAEICRNTDRAVHHPGGRSHVLLKLKKFSTMGSACTFPVESLGFLCITLAAVLTARGQSVCLRNVQQLIGSVAIFGDDIVAPEDSRELLFDALEVLDFKVNLDKSFWTGRFRESCGLDAYNGEMITPAYWHAPNGGKPESIASTIEVSNNFYQRFLIRTAGVVARTVQRVYPVVSMDSGVLGLKSFVDPSPFSFPKRRWNKDLQRTEVKVAGLLAQTAVAPIENDSALLQFFTELPDPLTKWEGGVRSRPSLRKKTRWVAMSELTSSC